MSTNFQRSSNDGLPDNPWRPNKLLDTINGYQEFGYDWRRRVARIIHGLRWYDTSMMRRSR